MRSAARSAGATSTTSNRVYHAVCLTSLEDARDEWVERAPRGSGAARLYVLPGVAIDFRPELRQAP
jgi:hypothetical protein